MKEYRAYMCDFGHQWTLFKDKQDPEDSGDCVCSEGHPAVTLSKEPALDDVEITFRPAGRVVDTVKEQVHGRGKYYIVISNLAGTQERVSKKVYSWEEIYQIGKRFDKRSFEWALTYWESLSL
ncbi:MAG: hypothetical protein ACYT04_53780 [Nostoc sp.]